MLEGNTKVQVNKTENTQVQLVENLGARRQNNKPVTGGQDDLQVDSTYSKYIDQAMAEQQTDPAVEAAQKLLASGALDTPEAARLAAQNLLNFGI